MNLKLAFFYQKQLNAMFEYFKNYLRNDSNLFNVEEKHFRSRVVANQIDEVIDVTERDKKKYSPDMVIDFLLVVLEEREKLDRAIHDAKLKMNFDIDTSVDINKKRRSLVISLRLLRQVESSSVLKRNSGVGYIFNNEGNQTTYRYDVETVKTINFDRNKARDLATKLFKESAELSPKIEDIVKNTEVDYVWPFSLNTSSEEIFEEYYSL